MRSFTIRGPNMAGVEVVPDPVPDSHEAVISVEAAGVCGTDFELYRGTMPYFGAGLATYPLQPGHEWCGVVVSIGSAVDPTWLGVRVVGDPIIGCAECQRCVAGRPHLCVDRYEVGVRNGWPGALAEKVRVPVRSLHRIPNGMSAHVGALIEPASNALRAVDACRMLEGASVCIWGPGTLGLLAIQFARLRGAGAVDLVGKCGDGLDIATTLGVDMTYIGRPSGGREYDSVIDASNSPLVPGIALSCVKPGGIVSLLGIADEPSLVDLRSAVLNDVTLVGLLSGSPSFAATIDLVASGVVCTDPLIAEVIALEELTEVLEGKRRSNHQAPKVLVDPRS